MATEGEGTATSTRADEVLERLIPTVSTTLTETLRTATAPIINKSDSANAFHKTGKGIAVLQAINKGDKEEQKVVDAKKTDDDIDTDFVPSRLPFIRIHKGQISHGFMGVDRAIDLLQNTPLCFLWIVLILLHYPVNKSATNRFMERNKSGTGLAHTMQVLIDEILPLLTAILLQFIDQEKLSMFPVTLICGLADGAADCVGEADLRKVNPLRIAHFEQLYRIRTNTLLAVVEMGVHVVVKSGELWKTWAAIMEEKGARGRDATTRSLGFNRSNMLDESMRVAEVDGFYKKDSTGKETGDIHLHQTHPSARYTPKIERQLDRINLGVLSKVQTLQSWYFRTLIPGINAAYGNFDGDRTALMIALNRPDEKEGIVAKIKELLRREMAPPAAAGAEDEDEE